MYRKDWTSNALSKMWSTLFDIFKINGFEQFWWFFRSLFYFYVLFGVFSLLFLYYYFRVQKFDANLKIPIFSLKSYQVLFLRFNIILNIFHFWNNEKTEKYIKICKIKNLKTFKKLVGIKFTKIYLFLRFAVNFSTLKNIHFFWVKIT